MSSSALQRALWLVKKLIHTHFISAHTVRPTKASLHMEDQTLHNLVGCGYSRGPLCVLSMWKCDKGQLLYHGHKSKSLPTSLAFFLALVLTHSFLGHTDFFFTSFKTYWSSFCPEPLYNLSSTWKVHLVRATVPTDFSSNITSFWTLTDLSNRSTSHYKLSKAYVPPVFI